MFFMAPLIGAVFSAYPKEVMIWAEKMFKDKGMVRKMWLSFVIWAGLVIWLIYSLFF